MKYFTYELIAAANDWIDQSKGEFRQAEARLQITFKKYFRELESLRPRVSQAAWRFFRYGIGNNGLHDARLLSLRIGDGLNYEADGVAPFGLNRQRASALIEFLNYEQDSHYSFDLRAVSRVQSDLFVEEGSYAKALGDLYIYELTGAGKDSLQLGFLFASGASMVLKFQRLVFRRRQITRSYEIGDMYL